MNPAIASKRRYMAAQARAEGEGSCETGQVNVGEAERWLSMFGGGVLITCGLLRGSLSGLTIAGLGAALAYRGYTGHCHMYEALDYNTAETTEREATQA